MGSHAHRKLANVATSLGAKRLMAFSLGSTRVIISSHPETAKEILSGSSFSDRPVKESAKLLMFERAMGFAKADNHWRHLRRIATTHMFSPRRIFSLEGLRQRMANKLVEGVCNDMKIKGFVELRKILRKGSLDSVLESVFGGSLGVEKEMKLGLMVNEGYGLISEFNWQDYLPFGFLDFNGVKRRCNKLANNVKDLVIEIIIERRGEGELSSKNDFLSALLALPEDEQLCDEDMVAVLWEMVFRGAETVAILLEWIMARIILHQDIQQRAQQEIDNCVGQSRLVQDSDISSLPFLQAIVKEVLRLHPPGPLLSWARLATQDVHVDKYFIPAGTTAMVNMWAISHDPSIWEDPWAFKPERFIENEFSILGSDLRLSPFGSGRRACPGKFLGLSLVHLWLARLLQMFEWGPLEHQKVDLSECLKLSLEMKKPLVCNAIQIYLHAYLIQALKGINHCRVHRYKKGHSGEHLYSGSTHIAYLDMQTRKKVIGRSSRELASPKASRHQKGPSKSTQFQSNKATDLITSSARKQKSGVSLLKQNGNYVGLTDLESRFQLDDDAPVECVEQDTKQEQNSVPVDNKGFEDESAPQVTGTIFSPAFHLTRRVEAEDANADPGTLSSVDSDINLSMKNGTLGYVECSPDCVSVEVEEVGHEELAEFDPYHFIKNLPDLSSVVPVFRPVLLPRKTRSCPSTTLVLDLDETLVHSLLEPCQIADFTFQVDLKPQKFTVYVRCRPYLRDFLERISALFEVIIFTASQSIYAEQLLNVLDPKRKIFRHRIFRESCVCVEGNYLKDLSVLGRDLSHVIIVDNSPQVFGFQIDNGVPIESWYDDPSDKELLLLLPFLESLVGVDDVRPLIAKKFKLRERIAAAAVCPFRSGRVLHGR
ncbi:oxygenase [Lithospermum erythrorhizon]|uniref:Oxygenase n=1 Tax=Lithospermum erythrorhizon TaxID=34254 RepID=A0AAV3R5K0_LITER